MRNKFLKGLSVAFAAAMAFTVVAPALTTEAASAKTYVISQKTDENGNVTKYTYDSRGRVTKEVTTNTVNTGKNISYTQGASTGTQNYPGAATIGLANDVVTTTVMINGTLYSTNIVGAVAYDNEGAILTTIDDLTTTTNYTYYNSGAKKDQVKSKTVRTERRIAVANDSTVNDNDYGYIQAWVQDEVVDYTYDSKGQCTKEVSTKKAVGSVNDASGNITPTYLYSLVQSTGAAPTGLVRDKAWVDAQNHGNNIGDYAIVVVTKDYTRNSKGQAVSATTKNECAYHDETWNAANDTKTGEVDRVFTSDGNTGAWTYNKNGLPTKFVQTVANKQVTANVGGTATAVDGTDSVTTFTYTYGDDMQLVKKEAVGKNISAASAGVVVNITIDKDGNTSTTTTANQSYTNDFKTTTTYNYTLKDGTIMKTSDVATVKTVTNGYDNKESDFVGRNYARSYTLKKISVPSSRAEAVLKDQFQKQTDYDWQ